MENHKVYLETCKEYNLTVIEKICSDAITFLDIKVPESSKILLKPNVLGVYEPERQINTHPVVVEAIIRLFLDKKNKLVLGDSSGNGQYGSTSRALVKTGFTALGKKYGIEVRAFDKHTNRVFKNKENLTFRKINLTSYIDEVDYIVNVPKLKSHTFLSYTGAVKNFYGCIPGAGKPLGHIKAPGPVDFSNGLIDIYTFIKPKIFLNIMDGIIGIEGAGPGPAGKVKKAGFLGFSECAFALDTACLYVLGQNPRDILTNSLGIKRKLFSGIIEKNKELDPIDFKIPKASAVEAILNRIFPGFALSKPYAMGDKCIQCGLCAKACPAHAITMEDFPVFNYKKCIYCFCCHENCPEAAIGLKENFIFRIFKSMTGGG